MLICGGFNVYPAIIEAAVNDLPDVVDSVAAGLPDERRGNPGRCRRSPARSSARTRPDERRTSLETAAYEIPPAGFSCVDEIPRTPNGKLDRRAIATLFTS